MISIESAIFLDHQSFLNTNVLNLFFLVFLYHHQGSYSIVKSKMSDVVTRDISKFVYANRPMSKYVFEVFDLEVDPQSRLIVVPRVSAFSAVTSQDKVTSVARAYKQLIHHTFVPTLKFCYDEADRTVYCLAANDQVAETYCAYSVRVGEVNVTFCKVSSIVMRKNSVRAYFDVDITVKGNCSGAILENEVVSMFIFENLDLVPRDQSSVIAVKDLDTKDKGTKLFMC
ncbi:uncharacterized protein [Miscanthus floridulus]|uniref:uncharacterized protein isoform X2 n=1 Tax=Miscanthus floridulus TaxID=154761 RepID=UPI00345AB853